MVANGNATLTGSNPLQISADVLWVVYTADQDTDEVFEVYSRSIDGAGAPTKLNAPMVAGGDVTFSVVRVSPDATRVVYRADQDTDEVYEVYSRTIDGSGAPIKLNGPLVTNGDVCPGSLTDCVQISYDSRWVVYLADEDADTVNELYSRRIDGIGAPIKLNATLVNGGDVSQFQISADSTRVVYLADQDTDQVFELYSRPIDGSGTLVKLNTAGAGLQTLTGVPFLLSPDARWAVYRADQLRAAAMAMRLRVPSCTTRSRRRGALPIRCPRTTRYRWR